MPSARRRIYWDSDVFLSYINEMADRLPVLDALLAEAASPNGSIEICSSVLSQVEVAFARTEQDNRALDPTVEEKIDSLWADRKAVKVVEYHEAIGVEARKLIRLAISQGYALKPVDAIHLATAKWFNAQEYHCYDQRLDKYSDILGIPILRPRAQQPRLL